MGRYTGSITHYAHDGIGRLRLLDHRFMSEPANVAASFAYNPASQIVLSTRTNDAYAFAGHGPGTTASAVNGLNQLTQAGGTAMAYDARGNLVSDGATSFTYDPENRLVEASGAHNASLIYDPLGRLYMITTPAEQTQFLYDGDMLVAEHHVAGGPKRRYVHGFGVDEPLVWYEGAGLDQMRYLHADERGSVVAVTDANSHVIAINKYDEYGVPASTNIGRFQYTGQLWLPEIGRYYYKARTYDPVTGRFDQTDPAGYVDGNWYVYVGNDPVNMRDPTGKQAVQDQQLQMQIADMRQMGMSEKQIQQTIQSQGVKQAEALVGMATLAVPVAKGIGWIGRTLGIGQNAERAVLTGKVANQAASAAMERAGFQSAREVGKVVGWGGGRNAAAQAAERVGQSIKA